MIDEGKEIRKRQCDKGVVVTEGGMLGDQELSEEAKHLVAQQEQKKNKIKQKSNVFTRVFIVKEFVRERWNHRGKKVTNTYKDMARKAAWSVGRNALKKILK